MNLTMIQDDENDRDGSLTFLCFKVGNIG